MPRDANGNYTLPAGNPVVTGTTIETAWANPTMDDIKQALTDSLDRYGRGGMQAPFRFVDGTNSAPGISWASELSTGFYRAGAADMRATVAGIPQMRWTGVGVDVWDSLGAAWIPLSGAGGVGYVPKTGGTFTGGIGVEGNLNVYNSGELTVRGGNNTTLCKLKVDSDGAVYWNTDPSAVSFQWYLDNALLGTLTEAGLALTTYNGNAVANDLYINRTGGAGGYGVGSNSWIQLWNTTDGKGGGVQASPGGGIQVFSFVSGWAEAWRTRYQHLELNIDGENEFYIRSGVAGGALAIRGSAGTANRGWSLGTVDNLGTFTPVMRYFDNVGGVDIMEGKSIQWYSPGATRILQILHQTSQITFNGVGGLEPFLFSMGGIERFRVDGDGAVLYSGRRFGWLNADNSVAASIRCGSAGLNIDGRGGMWFNSDSSYVSGAVTTSVNAAPATGTPGSVWLQVT